MKDWDFGVKVGDLITAYHKGFHRVTEIKERFYTADDEKRHAGGRKEGQQYNSLLSYKTVMSSTYRPSKAKTEKQCDAGFCKALDKAAIEARRDELVGEITSGTDALLGLLC